METRFPKLCLGNFLMKIIRVVNARRRIQFSCCFDTAYDGATRTVNY